MATQTVEFYGLNNLPIPAMIVAATPGNAYTTTLTSLAFQGITAVAGGIQFIGTNIAASIGGTVFLINGKPMQLSFEYLQNPQANSITVGAMPFATYSTVAIPMGVTAMADVDA